MLPGEVSERLRSELHLQPAQSLEVKPVGGGSINQSYVVKIRDDWRVFVKVNDRLRYPLLFNKEKAGLELLSAMANISVPEVLLCVETDRYQLLMLQWVEAMEPGDAFWKKLGSDLARLHQVREEFYGLPYDNYIGSLIQENGKENNWNEFFLRHRLLPQLQIAIRRGMLDQRHELAVKELLEKMKGLFEDGKPSLLHGDLWSGNYLCGPDEEPYLLDPAVYFGHRSMDLGMTTLFGGFDRLFYEAYDYHFPLSPHYHTQWEIANLYPLLVHLNLFGISYRSAIEDCFRKYA